jgi:hypothetical protein
VIRALACDTTLWTDDVWVVDSTPVECGRTRQTATRSEFGRVGPVRLRRHFWGLRLHLVCTLGGLPVGFALTGAKADERQTLLGILAADPASSTWNATVAALPPGSSSASCNASWP